MITIDALVGALLAEVAKGRGVSDQASVRLAEHYLHHELLKGFPVPRMQVSSLDIDLNFAVATNARDSHLLEDPEVQKGILFQIRDFLAGLPDDRDFHEYFRDDASFAAKWRGGLGALDKRLEPLVAKPAPDREALIRKLSIGARNYFHESAPESLRLTVGSLLARRVKRRKDNRSMAMLIEDSIRSIVVVIVENVPPAAESPADLKILATAAELEKVNPSLLNRMRITISPADRRWVTSEKNGEKIHILGT